MKTRKLGTQGLQVSALGLGCMGMSIGYGAADEPAAIATIHRAIDLCITLFDTADAYGAGENEQLLRRAIVRRERVTFSREKGAEDRGSHSNKRSGGLELGVHDLDANWLPIFEPAGQSVSPKTQHIQSQLHRCLQLENTHN